MAEELELTIDLKQERVVVVWLHPGAMITQRQGNLNKVLIKIYV